MGPDRIRRRTRSIVGICLTVALVSGVIPGGVAELLNGQQNIAAAAPPLTPPDRGTPDEIDGRQFGDPAAGIDLAEEPGTDSFGSAQFTHPIEIPTGRINWQPGISLAYSSDGGDDWLGLGWELSLDAIKVPSLGAAVSADAIEVDTRWGVPIFDPDKETETYVFGGEQLAPAAHHRSQLLDRVSERIFSKRVEADYLRILRHGNDPSNYWWEVHDKLGNKYFYGGVLDEPPHDNFDNDGNKIGTFDGAGRQDPNAVLFDREGRAYWWGLKEKWDISTNVVTYYYDKQIGDTGINGGTNSGARGGVEMYLKRINYTGYRLRETALDGPALPRFGPYDIEFVRDSELPGYERRPDVTMDATNGELEVTAELLRKINVWYTPQPDAPVTEGGNGMLPPPDVPIEGRTKLVRSYNLNYETGPFEKSLLTSVEKTDENDNVVSKNTFDYYDEVPRKDGTYNVFGPAEKWDTGDDDLSKEFLGIETGTVLGGSDSIGGDGRLFLGIGIGGKTISVGGGLQFEGSDGEANIEFIDINGDNLPDKVFKDGDCGASVCYRLNTSGASGMPGEATFSEARPIDGLSHLSESNDFAFGAGAEAYGGPASVMFNMAFTFSKETSYFSDVNADGLPDLVVDGDVLFNQGERNDRIEFKEDSGDTEVPLDQTGTLDPSIVPELNQGADLQADMFPRVDTVRRWVAPFAGDVSIEAPVSLADPQRSVDGVRVAIQHNASELWSADIPGGDGEVRTPTTTRVSVARGDRVYFRVGSKSNGDADVVNWDPKITYLDAPLDNTDVNGYKKFVYQASDDFTFSGYNGTFVGVPLDGRVEVAGDVVKTNTTSDDVQIRIFRNDDLVYCNAIAADEVGTFSLSEPALQDCDLSLDPLPANVQEFDVTGTHPDPQDPDTDIPGDKIKAEIDVNTNIDPNAITWKPKLTYVSATDENGDDVPVIDENGEPVMSIGLPTTVAIYPNTDSPMPQETDSPEDDGDNVQVTISATQDLEDVRDEFGQPVLPTDVVFSIKTRDGRPAFETTFTIPRIHENGEFLNEVSDNGYCTGQWSAEEPIHFFELSDPCSIDWGAIDDEDYYYDFTFQDPGVQRYVGTAVAGSGFVSARWWGGPRMVGDDVDVFPPPHRGWGYVGYNGTGDRALAPINEDDLLLKEDELPSCDDPDENGCEDTPSGFASGTPEGQGTDDPDFKNPVNGKYYIYVPSPDQGYWRGPKDVDIEGLTPEEIEQLGDLVLGRTWGGPGQASSTLTSGDEVPGPEKADIITPGATAPVIYGEANARGLGGGFGGFGGGATWAESKGMVDFLDLNGDSFPDVVGTGCGGCPDGTEGVLYTNQIGVPSKNIDHGWSDVHENHEFADQAGAGGAPAAPKTKANGDGNTVKNAGGSSTPTQRKGKGGGGAKKSGGKKPSAAKSSKKSGGKGSGKAGGKSRPAKAGRALGRAIPYLPSLGLTATLGKQETNSGEQLPEMGSNAEDDLADLNGDGLPDRIGVDKDSGNLFVKWNLGYEFSKEALWLEDRSLEEAGSGSESLDVGIGFGAGIFDFSGGVQVGRESESTHVTWADVNGDGLDDRLSVDVDGETGFLRQDSTGVTVQLNTGTGLAGGIPFGSFEDDHVAMGESTSLGGGADFTIAIPLPYCLGICQFIVNPGFHVTKGHNAPRIDLVDVDGDGYLDSVSSGRDSELYVRRNRIGRTNLLKKITRPLGATIELSYEREGNTPNYPESTWVLSRVETNDGHSGDGVDDQVTTYRFEDPKFSYAEREEYGFATVIEEERDPTTNAVYRSWERTYDNTSYYGRGLLQSEVLRDGESRPVITTANTYRYVDSQEGSDIDEVQRLFNRVATVFPRLVSEETRWHNSPTSNDVVRTHEVTYDYDKRGNITKITDLGEAGTASDDVAAEMGYDDIAFDGDVDDGLFCDGNKEYPWVQFGDVVVVKSGDTVLQRREGLVACDTSSVAQVRDYLDPATTDETPQPDEWCTAPIDELPAVYPVNPKISVTEVCYLPVGGQLSRLIGPANENGQRYVVDYSYRDPDEIGSFVTETRDNFGLVTTDTYDNRFGRLVRTEDPVGAMTTYEYDARNRLTGVVGPFEQGTGNKTVTYEYHADEDDDDSWVIARNIDPANPGTTIENVTFIDGLEREIQTKTDATLFAGANANAVDRRVVSGRIDYDGFGRVVREHYPIDEPMTMAVGDLNETVPSQAMDTTYDVLDRTTTLMKPAPSGQTLPLTTTYEYGFANGVFGRPMLTTLQTGPGTARTRTYSDVRENIVGVERLHTVGAGTQSLLTRYDYDPLQRLAKVTSLGGKSTTASYDLMGRRTTIDNSDTGKVSFRYDLASNIVGKITPKLRPANTEVSYTYDHNRLTGVRFPNDPSQNVTYTYGAAGAGTAAGLITRVDDGARTEDRVYDELGNVVEETSVIKVKNLSPTTLPAHTYTSRFTYDTWGRLLDMTFPDGEVLRYGFDSGGLVKSAVGTKQAATTSYVGRLEYDRFGNRRFMDHPNGTTIESSFDPNTLWLSDQLVKKGSKTLADLHYLYDRGGNVTLRKDTRPLAPSGEKGGPSTQTFTYDDLYRLTRATGSYSFPPSKTRTYTIDMTYDDAGRVVQKKQVDKIGILTQAPTTYTLGSQYNGAQEHAPTRVGNRTYTWDADGNLTSWKVDKSTTRRTMTWDELDRMRSVTDGGSTTEYLYDYDSDLSIRRGPQGETEFVNDEYTALNGTNHWKNIFVDDLQVAVKKVEDPAMEYYLTGDLTDSVNLVTDPAGNLFEHALFFPAGDFWVREKSNVQRERYMFARSYLDETKLLYGLGSRWYEPREGMFYSADPVLTADLDATVEEPRLLGGFNYAFDNPETYIDETGDYAITAQMVFATAARNAASNVHNWLRVDTDYEEASAKLARDAYGKRFATFLFTKRESKLDNFLEKFEPAFFEPTLVLDEDGYLTGWKVSEDKIETIKSIGKFLGIGKHLKKGIRRIRK